MSKKIETSKIMAIDMQNPWHKVEIGDSAPDIVNAIVEIPKNTRAKYELDKKSGMLLMDRVIYSSMYYPANYGFIPRTYCDDKDPLDILVLSQIAIVPMCIVSAKVIGVMRMIDNGEMDDKIIAVAENDMGVNHFDEISQVHLHFIDELKNFFEDYKKLEKKTVAIEDFQDASVAKDIIKQSIEDYDKYTKNLHDS